MQNAITLIQKFRPRACFIDGSLILHPSDKPGSESLLKKEYERTIALFTQLYATAHQHECMLIGAVEDSRSTRLGEWIHTHMNVDHGNEKMYDVPLMEHVLQPGERSLAFSIAEKNTTHPTLSDVSPVWQEKLYACYLKPSQWDYPLRIEFLSDKETLSANATRAAEIAYAQSALHKEYAFPSILVEADMRAGLNPEEIELVSDKILSKLGRHTLRMKRRDRRPF